MAAVGKGHVIAGKYRLEEQLGQGGMGAVWSAEHLALHSRIAIKLIVPDHAEDEGMLTRFVREARSAAALRSPHVVQILDYGVDQGLAYIAMERLEGESLADRILREGHLAPALTATILTHVARAMTRAHDMGLMHRDLKPENIFLVKNDDEILAKVLDFGIVKGRPGTLASTGAVTESGVLIGSPFYMSPEQAHGRTDTDHRSDLWAMAVIAYVCLTGQRPFSGTVLGEVMLQICVEPMPVPSSVAAVPDGFDEWFLHAANRDPAKRFQSARELAATLRGVLGTTTDGPSGKPAAESVAQLSEGAAVAATTAPDENRSPRFSPEAHMTRTAEPFASTTGPLSQDDVKPPAEPAPERRAFPLRALVGGAVALVVAGAFWILGTTPAARPALVTAESVTKPIAASAAPAKPPEPTPPAPVVVPAASVAASAAPAVATVTSAAPATSAPVSAAAGRGTPSAHAPHAASGAATAHAAKGAPSAAPAEPARPPPPATNPLDIRL